MAAASELFAERGFHATAVRDIARRADANLAAVSYHYGSKKGLYLAVFRSGFAEVRALLERRGAERSAEEIARLGRAALRDLLQTRVRAMLDFLLGPPPAPYATLLQRELLDPSEALPIVVREFLEPIRRPLRHIVSRLGPELGEQEVERCVFSVVGQTIFYRTAMPAILLLLGEPSYRPSAPSGLAAHITEFSLGGIRQVARAAAAARRGVR